MASRIKLLDETTRNLIAAGEVVERPASVVKELVENALDAGATRITIELEAAGTRLIRVTDDGCGMGREDAELSFQRHATSKIGGVEDLRHIATLGFRGEALPSIAVVSRFELETRPADQPAGTRVVVEGGRVLELDEAPRAPGTTATVRNLFFNVPARRKFLKSDSTELRRIAAAVTGIAIAQLGTSFRLLHEGRELLGAVRCRTVEERVEELFGRKRLGRLLTVVFERGESVVGGLISAPDSIGGGKPEQFMFINRRPFHSRALAHAVIQGYQSAIPESAQPSFFLFLTMDPGEVDVNVHPSKLEVRFRDEGLVYSLVHHAVQQGLRQEDAVASFGGADSGGRLMAGKGGGRQLSRALRDSVQGGSALTARGLQTSFFVPLESRPPSPAGAAIAPVFPAGGAAAPATQPEENAPGPQSETPPDKPSLLPSLWQVHGRYIFAETKNGCLIIDQHAAHERILYEQIMAGMKAGGVSRQLLLFPVTLELDPEELLAVREFMGLLEQAGFQVEEFGGRTVVVRARPSLPDLESVEDYFRDLLRDLSREGQGSTGTRHQRLARALACRAAIKTGQRLSPTEMNELLDRLFATELPYADVHGRNTIVELPVDEINKRFGRS